MLFGLIYWDNVIELIDWTYTHTHNPETTLVHLNNLWYNIVNFGFTNRMSNVIVKLLILPKLKLLGNEFNHLTTILTLPFLCCLNSLLTSGAQHVGF